MSKITYNVFLKWNDPRIDDRKYLGTVRERNIWEATAAAECSLSSHDPDECYLEVIPVDETDMEDEV